MKRILWAIAIILFISGDILLAIYFSGDFLMKLPGLITILILFIIILSTFLIDSIEVIIFKKTAEDKYTVKNKEVLISLSKKRGLDFKKRQPKSYYLQLLREDDKKRRKNG